MSSNIIEDIKIVRIFDRPDLKEVAAKWFHDRWKVELAAYLESMELAIFSVKAIPQWYVALLDEKIIAGIGVISNDFHERTDLAPNICALYVDDEYRKRGIAGKMLKYVCDDMYEKGIDPLYLVTEHTSFYERYGWDFFCMAKEQDSEHMTRLYIHRQSTVQ